jgi:hypothetical protein
VNDDMNSSLSHNPFLLLSILVYNY